MKNKVLQPMALSVLTLALSACGGGGSSSPTPTPASATPSLASPAPTDSGSVSAQFVPSSSVGYIELNSAGEESFGSSLTPFTQATSGAVTVFSTYSLTGSSIATADIAGDTNFAMGRWVNGTAADSNPQNPVSQNLSTITNSSWHYIVYNKLAVLPTSGTRTCDIGKFTAPSLYSNGTYAGNTPLPNFGSATGTATLYFNASGANISTNVITTAGTATGTATVSGTTLSPSTSVFAHTLSNGVAIADAGNGAIRLIGVQQTTLSNGSVYQGLFEFTCS